MAPGAVRQSRRQPVKMLLTVAVLGLAYIATPLAKA
jgi:hypothetical protein